MKDNEQLTQSYLKLHPITRGIFSLGLFHGGGQTENRILEPSEHDGVTYRTLGATQIDCLGENEPVQMKPPFRRRITENPILSIASDAEF